MTLSAVRKTVINVLGLLVTATPLLLNILNQPPFQGTTTAIVVSGLLALVGAVVHNRVPNVTTDPGVAATQSVRLVAPKLPGTASR